MIKMIRELLRQIPLWITIQELRREGGCNVFQRLKVQRKVLNTAPVFTEVEGEVEIHVLTWRKDYINLLWSLKTFYHLSNKKFPLVIHDGGLGESHKLVLKEHFPNSRLISRDIMFLMSIENQLWRLLKILTTFIILVQRELFILTQI